MKREIKIIQTEDGSHSLYVPELNESYHSFHGALSESMHVFIKKGLLHWLEQHPEAAEVKILEVGLGTALNALLTIRETFNHKKTDFDYTALEAFPLEPEITQKLNYGEMMKDETLAELFVKLHEAAWNLKVKLTHNFFIQKMYTKLEDFQQADQSFDVVYYDAFAPSKQAEMWTQELLAKVAAMIKAGGVLVTYCAKGQFKRDLKAVGFEVETLDGPPGKKEMVRGTKV
jgi:tRNA U34 5-methylaminomethyl-2-thiouridine-forming methyltransferase MnmC